MCARSASGEKTAGRGLYAPLTKHKNHMACVHTSLRSAESRVRLDLGRYEFSAREWKVINLLLLESLNREREQIPVNGMDDLVKRLSWSTGMRTDHCRETLRGLFKARVLLHDDPFTFCMVDVDPARWGLRESDRADQPPFAIGVNGELFPGPSVAAEIAKLSLQERAGELPAALPESGRTLPNSGSSPSQGDRELPNSGTDRDGLAESASPQIGEDATKPLQNAGEIAVLPKSGSSNGLSPNQGAPQVREGNVVQRLNVSSKENVINVVTLQLPESGSACLPKSGSAPKPRDEGFLIARVRQFVGDEDWAFFGGAWVTHGVRRNYETLEKALNDVEQTVREGRIRVRHRGRYLWKIFGLFGGRKA